MKREAPSENIYFSKKSELENLNFTFSFSDSLPNVSFVIKIIEKREHSDGLNQSNPKKYFLVAAFLEKRADAKSSQDYELNDR